MEWISVKEKGLPEPNMSKMYFTLSESDHLGYGVFTYEYDWDPTIKRYTAEKKLKWFLDFDAHGEGEITHYMEVEYPMDE